MWDVTGSILFNMRLYNSEKSSPSTIRLNKIIANLSVKPENTSYNNQRAGYQCTGLSTYDLQLTFQLLDSFGEEE